MEVEDKEMQGDAPTEELKTTSQEEGAEQPQPSAPATEEEMAQMTPEEREREKMRWENYIPPDAKRPTDEFFDLDSIEVLREE